MGGCRKTVRRLETSLKPPALYSTCRIQRGSDHDQEVRYLTTAAHSVCVPKWPPVAAISPFWRLESSGFSTFDYTEPPIRGIFWGLLIGRKSGVQKLANRPGMIGEAKRHCWRRLMPNAWR